MASAQPQQTPSNPFDGFDAYTGVAAPPPPASSGGSVVSSVSVPTVGSSQQQAFQPQQPTVPVQQPPSNMPNNTMYQPHPGQVQVNPFPAPNIGMNHGALVPSVHQTNPYALNNVGFNQPPPQPQQFLQQPMAQHNSQQMMSTQHHMAQSQQVMPQQTQPFMQQSQQMVHVGAANAWGIATAGNVNQIMMPPPVSPSQNNQPLVAAAPSSDPFGIFDTPAPPQPTQLVPSTPQQNLEKQMQTLQFNSSTPGQHSILPNADDEEGLALIDVELDEDTNRNDEGIKQEEESTKSSDRESERKEAKSHQMKDKNADIAPPPPMPPGRQNAEYIAQNSGGITSPLPLPSLVLHAGYVLARISFRTVLLRKWKQTFWIQYGPTQLLFFRSYADFVDWLNNPYHSAKARDYLVKLRVDFVSDLKKKSVMGYQVTQIRRKPYSKNIMLHFKLERWMDYGPTIAAAFAARQEEMIQSEYYKNNKDKSNHDDEEYGGMNTANDVSALRKIILGCMRNARDQALIASHERTERPREAEYQGRYAEDATTQGRAGRDEGSPEKFHTASKSSKAGIYHQAFAAESSGRRKYQGGVEQNGGIGDESQSDSNRDERAVEDTPVLDLLG